VTGGGPCGEGLGGEKMVGKEEGEACPLIAKKCGKRGKGDKTKGVKGTSLNWHAGPDFHGLKVEPESEG